MAIFKDERVMTPFYWDAAIPNQLYLLMICQFIDPEFTQCTENVWADMMLNGGHPSKYTVYGHLNVFTWEGWFELLMWGLFMAFWIDLFTDMGSGMLGVIYWMVDDPEWKKPFCKPGELTIAGTDCSEWMEALGFYNSDYHH